MTALLQGATDFPLRRLPAFLGDPQPNVIVLAPPKKHRRAAEKVEDDYDGDWGRLLDVVRCSVVVESISDLRDAVKRVLEAGARYARLPEDRLDRPLANGYRDYRANYRLPCGLVCEVQYHTTETLLERERDHGRYEVTRECRKGMQSHVGKQQAETLLDAALDLGRPDYALRSALTGPVAPEEMFTKGESMNVQKGTPEGPYRSPWSSGDWYLVTDVRGKDVVWVVVQNGRQRSEFPPHQSRRDALAWLRDNGYELKKTIKSWL